MEHLPSSVLAFTITEKQINPCLLLPLHVDLHSHSAHENKLDKPFFSPFELAGDAAIAYHSLSRTVTSCHCMCLLFYRERGTLVLSYRKLKCNQINIFTSAVGKPLKSRHTHSAEASGGHAV